MCTLTYKNVEYKWVEGTIIGIKENGWFELKTQYSPGYSGSPVINSKGEVIGIASSMYQGMNADGVYDVFELGRAIPCNFLNSLLEETEDIESFAAWQKRSDIRPYALLVQAQSKQALGKNRSAIRKYDLLLKLNPNITRAYINRGAAKSSLGNHIEAIEDYNKAIELGSYNPTTYYNRGRANSSLGESKAKQGYLVEARSHYQMAIDDL